MFILTDKSTGGVYAVYNKDRVKTVQLFEDSEDAQDAERSAWMQKL